MVRLAAVVIKTRSLNWRWVTVKGLLFRRATVGSGCNGVLNRVERNLNTLAQNVCAVGHSHHICVDACLV